MSARLIIGDVFDALATLPENSVDLVFSSPPSQPFLALRSYLPADHPLKAKEIGSEATPADFLDTLLDVVEALDRVLAPHGSLCFELGDTFAGASNDGGDYTNIERGRPDKYIRGERPVEVGKRKGEGWPLDKSLCLIPTLFAASLAYGYNMLRPERKTPRWRVRNLIVWARPNPPVGALGDKMRPATSYVTVATKSRTRYFDLDAVREPHMHPKATHTVGNVADTRGDYGDPTKRIENHPAGAPPLDYWVIPTAPYKGSHYATFPPELVVKPVKAMSPQRVCRVCGEPSRRITSEPEYTTQFGSRPNQTSDQPLRYVEGQGRSTKGGGRPGHVMRVNDTLGWTDCGHDDYRPGVVLDPFAGSGTTLSVATGHGRDAIGVDLDERNADLALERVGPMFLAIEHLSTEGAA